MEQTPTCAEARVLRALPARENEADAWTVDKLGDMDEAFSVRRWVELAVQVDHTKPGPRYTISPEGMAALRRYDRR